jgi:prepilin-type N-terminal cleavage/methylation domain-containing protein/prepilin-type processing-associated H-X9-DG protein
MEKQAASRKPNCGFGSGFTLVEVLVVISIIGIIMAIVIPTVGRARENARSVVCRTVLNEWGRMMRMYADQYRDYLPFEDRGEEHLGRICWIDSIEWSSTSTEAPERIKACPTVHRSDPNREESFRMNSKLAETKEDSEHYQPYRRLNTLSTPDRVVLLFDGDVGGDKISFKGRWRVKDDDVNYRHNGSTNLLFTDGHVENFREKALYERSLDNKLVIWQPDDMGPWDPEP